MNNVIIAIDGPSGTGKGTIASQIAKEINFEYLDSGLYYRAVALLIIKNNLSLDNLNGIELASANMIIEINKNKIVLNNEDVTKEIRSTEVNSIVGEVSTIKNVRLNINDRIRSFCQNKNIVVDGRDIGTNVFPNANIKIYLDASVESRAKRRFEQNNDMGIRSDFEEVLNNIHKRDFIDYNREFGALKIAEDAHVINTTNLNIEETINIVKKIVEGELK